MDPQDDYDGEYERSDVLDDGTYIEIRYQNPIIHLKEFNSFYEKENFIIEAFIVSGSSGKEVLTPLKQGIQNDQWANDLAKQQSLEDAGSLGFYEEEQPTKEYLEFFFILYP